MNSQHHASVQGAAAIASGQQHASRGEFSDYVADLQLHMTLQARNLLPTLTADNDARGKLLRETQETIEKFASRQVA